jgi:3-hydroxyisobutyrate dehydrogenase-like beta-hydroxyacid dehydrogenase
MTVTRKGFLVRLATGGWALATAGCGGGYDDPPDKAGCVATIAANHGHALEIPAADLNANADRSYDILGTATHTHSVTFTAAQLASLKAGNTVLVTSTVGAGHTHQISERCT